MERSNFFISGNPGSVNCVTRGGRMDNDPSDSDMTLMIRWTWRAMVMQIWIIFSSWSTCRKPQVTSNLSRLCRARTGLTPISYPIIITFSDWKDLSLAVAQISYLRIFHMTWWSRLAWEESFGESAAQQYPLNCTDERSIRKSVFEKNGLGANNTVIDELTWEKQLFSHQIKKQLSFSKEHRLLFRNKQSTFNKLDVGESWLLILIHCASLRHNYTWRCQWACPYAGLQPRGEGGEPGPHAQ